MRRAQRRQQFSAQSAYEARGVRTENHNTISPAVVLPEQPTALDGTHMVMTAAMDARHKRAGRNQPAAQCPRIMERAPNPFQAPSPPSGRLQPRDATGDADPNTQQTSTRSITRLRAGATSLPSLGNSKRSAPTTQRMHTHEAAVVATGRSAVTSGKTVASRSRPKRYANTAHHPNTRQPRLEHSETKAALCTREHDTTDISLYGIRAKHERHTPRESTQPTGKAIALRWRKPSAPSLGHHRRPSGTLPHSGGGSPHHDRLTATGSQAPH